MNTQKKEIQKKRKSQKESVPVSPALYHVKKQCRHTNRAGYNNVCELID